MKLKELIAKAKGRFFTVVFVTKDGETKTANCKNSVKATLKGGRFTGAAKGYVPVFDRNANHWISVHPSRVKEFKCGSIHVKG